MTNAQKLKAIAKLHSASKWGWCQECHFMHDGQYNMEQYQCDTMKIVWGE